MSETIENGAEDHDENTSAGQKGETGDAPDNRDRKENFSEDTSTVQTSTPAAAFQKSSEDLSRSSRQDPRLDSGGRSLESSKEESRESSKESSRETSRETSKASTGQSIGQSTGRSTGRSTGQSTKGSFRGSVKGLGRGLEAIFGDSRLSSSDRSVNKVPVTDLVPSSRQPRRHFDPEGLKGLAQSLRQDGLVQPILVRPNPDKTAVQPYQIIAGERRWRAAQLANLHEVPIQLRETNDSESLQIALVENLQREDLNPIEMARGFQLLILNHGHTQETLAESLGFSRPKIANTMRLLKLPEVVVQMVIDKKLSAGHARCLIGLDNQLAEQLARESIAHGYGVRQLERKTRKVSIGGRIGSKPQEKAAIGDKKTDAKNSKPLEIINLEVALSNSLGMKVTISQSDSGDESGVVIIEYSKLDQFDSLMSRLVGAEQDY